MVIVKGMHIDRFLVVRFLGEGGIAQVYLVQHRKLQSLHALKVLHAQDPATARRFIQEGRAQARIRHPNVVAATDVVELPDGVGLVMEYVEGTTLADILDGVEPVPRPDILPLFRQILAGVIAAHNVGVLHRDLKPGNVLLSATPNGVHAKISDFGLAKLVEPTGTILTRAGQSMGTPGYMAPEQLSDAATVDARADVFSLGCILYELCAGRGPYLRADISQSWNATLAGEYRPLAEVDPGLPKALVDAVERAISPLPARRFATVEALEAALAGITPDQMPPRAKTGEPRPPSPPATDRRAAARAVEAAPDPRRETLAPGDLGSTLGPGAAGLTMAPTTRQPGTDHQTLGPEAMSGRTITLTPDPAPDPPAEPPRARPAAWVDERSPSAWSERPERFERPKIPTYADQAASSPSASGSNAPRGDPKALFYSQQRAQHRLGLSLAGLVVVGVAVGIAGLTARAAAVEADLTATVATLGAERVTSAWPDASRAVLELSPGATDASVLRFRAEAVQSATGAAQRAAQCVSFATTLRTEADRQSRDTEDIARRTTLQELQRRIQEIGEGCAQWGEDIQAAAVARAAPAASLALALGLMTVPAVDSLVLPPLDPIPEPAPAPVVTRGKKKKP